MTFRTLRTFVEVARQGGFSRAAKVVFTTQSTVSKAVKQLETELGVPPAQLDHLFTSSA
jgi:DNA-binding transcriptional LysR family regulator